MTRDNSSDSSRDLPLTKGSELDDANIEKGLQVALSRGEWVDLRVGDKNLDDPRNSADWGFVTGAHILGQLTFGGAYLLNRGGKALNADGLTVDRDMFCNSGFTAEGEVRLIDAQVGGQLVMSGAHLSNSEGPALAARGLTVRQDISVRTVSRPRVKSV